MNGVKQLNKKGVVDRIVNDIAVILIEESMEELHLNINEYNVKEGEILTITFEDDKVSNVEVNIKEMESIKRVIDLKLEKLRKRDSKYKVNR